MHFLRKNLNHSVHIRIIINTLSSHFYNIAWASRATIYKKGAVPKIDYFKYDFFPTFFFFF